MSKELEHFLRQFEKSVASFAPNLSLNLSEDEEGIYKNDTTRTLLVMFYEMMKAGPTTPQKYYYMMRYIAMLNRQAGVPQPIGIQSILYHPLMVLDITQDKINEVIAKIKRIPNDEL